MQRLCVSGVCLLRGIFFKIFNYILVSGVGICTEVQMPEASDPLEPVVSHSAGAGSQTQVLENGLSTEPSPSLQPRDEI